MQGACTQKRDNTAGGNRQPQSGSLWLSACVNLACNSISAREADMSVKSMVV